MQWWKAWDLILGVEKELAQELGLALALALGLGQVQVLGLGARGGLGTYPSTPLTSRSCPASTWRVCRRMWGQRPVRGLHQCRAPLLGDMCSRPRRTLPWPRSGS